MKTLQHSKVILAILFSLSFLMVKPVTAIPAFLPPVSSVPMAEPMSIDGVWTVSTINKNIRFEGGRAYAVDDWMHMLVLHIQPDMVVIKNVKQTASGTYVGDDLPLLAKFKAKLHSNGRMKVKVGAVAYELIPIELDYPDLMAEELQNLGGGNPPEREVAPAPSPNPDRSNCSQWAIDPETNTPVCLD